MAHMAARKKTEGKEGHTSNVLTSLHWALVLKFPSTPKPLTHRLLGNTCQNHSTLLTEYISLLKQDSFVYLH
jgi:hypothetical protein